MRGSAADLSVLKEGGETTCERKGRNDHRRINELALRVEVSVYERVRDHVANGVTMHDKQKT